MKNSKVLVSIQFILISLLLIFNDSIFNHTSSWIISLSGLLFAVYTLYCNRFDNFNITPEIKDNAKLITTGAYKYIRHPMYLCVLLIMFGVAITSITIVNIFLYEGLVYVLYLKAKKEEELWSKHSDAYKEYMKDTKMFIPFVL